ncbi:hypothetical protein [Streptomyces chartreusis]|uniref:hypothetical protein n=1 Tax=Streptomyces chartreusis TaxID=1969 RepID=UPI00123DF6DC|nr:hypothetical protein [Streptomyces chartreusis]QEV66251.1 hypothetical protein CP983_05945 [Streptomyces chartreusis]GGW98962.1 hypothetical protein GCM10010321_11790 [Streptomyces chartreusis]
MGMSTNAMLVYGYHLGSDDGGWLVRGVGEYGELPTLSWHQSESDDADFGTDVELRLLASVGFTETDWSADGYYDRKREAEARLGVELEFHCSGDYPMYLLTAKSITAYRGDAKEIDFAALQAETEQAGADAKLRAALEALELRPTQEQPRWLLCSYWG